MRRALVVLLLLPLLCQQAAAASEATVKRLHDDLLNNYDRHVRPVADSSSVTHVTFHIDILSVDLYRRDLLSVETWTYWDWKDELLKWEPSRYEGVKEVMMEASSIWTPELVHLSRGQMVTEMQSVMQGGGRCRVTSAGDVSCMTDASYYAHCDVDLSKWPYDSHGCFLSFINWLDLEEEVSIKLRNGTGFSTKKMKTPLEWQLVSVTSEQIPRQNHERNGYSKIDYYIKLKRHSEGYAATAVTPALVLSMATLLVLLIPPWETERFSVGLCLLAAQYMSLTDLYHEFSSDVTVPRIMLLYRDALLMGMVALVLAVVMRALIESDMDAPGFVLVLLDLVPTWPWGLSILAQPREDTAGRKEPRSRAVWRQLSSLVDRCCFCCYCLVLLILLAALIP